MILPTHPAPGFKVVSVESGGVHVQTLFYTMQNAVQYLKTLVHRPEFIEAAAYKLVPTPGRLSDFAWVSVERFHGAAGAT